MNIEQTQEGELMANRVRSIVLSFGFLFIIAGAADARIIFVNKASLAEPQDGTAARPFRTITQALRVAREIRFGSPTQSPSNETINVHVAPQNYVGVFGAPTFKLSPEPREALPLILNVPNLKLHGALRFNWNGTLVDGTKTSLEATTQPLEKQHMVVVTRTNPAAGSELPTSLEMVGDGVTVSGFVFEGLGGSLVPPLNQSALVFIDGVSGFLVSGNFFTHAGSFAISTRLSSGRIANNQFVDNGGVGINVTAGSTRFPATVEVLGNRVRNSGTGGIGLQGAAQTEGVRGDLFDAQQFQRFPRLPQFYDRVNLPDEVPDKLEASVKGNDVSGSVRFGTHVNGYVRDYYRLPPTEAAVTANVRARFVGNVFRSNGDYGIVVTAGQIKLPNPQTYKVNLDVSFDSTTLEANGTGPALFGFWRFATSEDLNAENDLTFKLAHDSAVTICGDITQFGFDNRAVDPTDNTATNNALTVNTMPLTGFCVRLHENCIFKLPPIPCP